MKIVIKIMGELQKNNEVIMEFWNDEIVFVTQRKWKM
jgi:hypothetical protein